MADRTENGQVIDEAEATFDTLTSRGGLTIFSCYLRNIAIYLFLEPLFGSIRKNAQGPTGIRNLQVGLLLLVAWHRPSSGLL